MFEQLHGDSDYMTHYENHVWALGAPAGELLLSGGPAGEAVLIQTTKKLASEMKSRFRIWKRSLTPAQVEKVQEAVAMTQARYAYLEAKVNGVVPMSAFPVAVCPRQEADLFRTFLDAAGFEGELIALDVPDEIYSVLTADWVEAGTSEQREAIKTWAQLQYGWHIADVLRKRGPRMTVNL